MPEQTTFGRRRQPAPPARRDPVAVETLSPAAEAFRAQLGGGRDESSAFGRWRRARQRRLILVWLVRIALLSPGLLSLALKASWPISVGLELAGIAAGWWLQRERRRHRADVLAWTDDGRPDHAG